MPCACSGWRSTGLVDPRSSAWSEMTEKGLKGVPRPERPVLADCCIGDISARWWCRPSRGACSLLVELQAPTTVEPALAAAVGAGHRQWLVWLLLAVLQQRVGVRSPVRSTCTPWQWVA